MSTHPLRIEASHPSLPGHFPGRPLVPGVVLLDEVLACAGGGTLARIPQVKFVAPLRPGEDARIEIERDGARARFRVLRGEVLLASGELHFAP